LSSLCRSRLFLPADQGLTGRLRVPGDKSISHRALLFGALNQGPVTISGSLRSADTAATMAALRSFGLRVEEGDGADLLVHGAGWEGLSEPGDVIDVGNSGTTMRLLPGVAAALPFLSVLSGDASIRRRPMARIIEPLTAMGATVLGRGGGLYPPMAVKGGRLRSIEHEMSVASAQVKSCLLLAGLRADGPSTIIEPAPSRDHTERMIRYAGGRVKRRQLPDGRGLLEVWPVEELHLEHIDVPGDLSSAAFFIVAALLVPDSEVQIDGVGLNPSRTAVLDVLERMGADIEVVPAPEGALEPTGTIIARSSELRATDVGADEVPNLIDELPLFLLAAARAAGVSRLRGAAELRAKESDRLAAMAAALRALGVTVTEHPDGMDVQGLAEPWSGGAMASAQDHRIAMVGAVAGLGSREGVTVDDINCTVVSFPGFTDALVGLGARVQEATG
jgi:3-phosphoshikimate 1-carboxyvinyltransferase